MGWEIYDSDSGTMRMEVEGGWLYRWAEAVVFVPDKVGLLGYTLATISDGEVLQKFTEGVLDNEAIFQVLLDRFKNVIEEAFRIVAEDQDRSLGEM